MRNRKETLQYLTKQELLVRVTKLEKVTQELEKKIREVLDSCSCIKASIEHERFIKSEGRSQLLTKPILKGTLEEFRCDCRGKYYHVYGCNSYPKDE